MKKWILWLSVVVVLCCAAESLYAPDDDAEGTDKKEQKKVRAQRQRPVRGPRVSGKVKSIDVAGGKLVISVPKRRDQEATEKTLLINDETKVRLGWRGGDKTLADVAEGKNVVVSYKAAEEEGGDPVAVLISIRVPQAFGKIKSIDVAGGKLVMEVRRGRDKEPEEKTFLIGEKTTVYVGREAKTLADVAQGNNVIITYEAAKEKDGTATVTSIMVRTARVRKPKKEQDG